MATPRMVLLNSLIEAWQKTPEKWLAAREAAKLHWHEKNLLLPAKASRAFDPYQMLNLAPWPFIHKKVKNFLSLPEVPKKFLVDMQIVDPNVHNSMRQWAQELVLYACETLLDEEGSINSEIIKALGCEDVSAFYLQSRISEILCSFVCVVLVSNIFVTIDAVKKKRYEAEKAKLAAREAQSHWVMGLFSAYVGSANKSNQAAKEVLNSKAVLTDSDIAKLGLVHKMTSTLVRERLDAKYNYKKLNSLAAAAENFMNVVLNNFNPELFFLEDKKLAEMVMQKKIEPQSRLGFWLEVMTQSIEHVKIFLAAWDVLQPNLSKDFSILNTYYRNQLDFCNRHYRAILKTKLSISPVIENFSMVPEESKAEVIAAEVVPLNEAISPANAPSMPEPETVKIAVPLVDTHSPVPLMPESKETMVTTVDSPVRVESKEHKSELLTEKLPLEENDDDFEIVPSFGPAIYYEVSALSLFQSVVLGASEAFGSRFGFTI